MNLGSEKNSPQPEMAPIVWTDEGPSCIEGPPLMPILAISVPGEKLFS